MSVRNRAVDALSFGAAGVLAAVPFVPYVAVGEQPYAAIGFIERINALLEMQLIDGSWRVPPLFALLTSMTALVVLALPRPHRLKGHMAVTALSALSVVIAYRFTGQSPILHPLMGPKLLVIGAALSLTAVIVDRLGGERPTSLEPCDHLR